MPRCASGTKRSDLPKGAKVEKLRIRVECKNENPNREVRIDLRVIYWINGKVYEKIQTKINCAEEFGIYLNKKVDKGRFKFNFDIFTKPFANEIVPSNESSENPQTEGEEQQIVDDILRQAIHRVVKVELFRPNFSRQLYVVNLGSADPPGRLNWNRRVFVEAENDAGNYHAFVYAAVDKNERILLGFAPFVKIENGNESSNAPQFSEYQLSLPVKLNPFFKRNIWFLSMDIYQFEETIYSIETKNESKSPITNSGDGTDDVTAGCSICLEELTNGQQIIKLHAEKGENYAHLFHENCIKIWFKQAQFPLCPLCKQTAKYETSGTFPPIFESSAEIFSNFHMNSIGELFRIGREDENEFLRTQAKHQIKAIVDQLNNSAKNYKNFLSNTNLKHLVPFLEQNFFEIGTDKFVETEIVGQIRNLLENFINDQQNRGKEDIAIAKYLLKLASASKIAQNSQANNAIEKLKIIREEQ
ncbi:hypothetical protein niasHS_017940 [Heterodera schachtii]|uniref:RING-type domain-containing protein n=2 Tax=Heterodera TaxID=34509 RepID=A0ABD2I141_HETSC